MMNWQQLLKDGRAERHRTSPNELEGLRAVVGRNLADANVAEISADTRFACAYEAALALATIALAHAGYRAKGPGHHRTTFLALTLAMVEEEDAEDARYFDACRRLRNELSYEAAGVVSVREVDELIQRVEGFQTRVESLLRRRTK